MLSLTAAPGLEKRWVCVAAVGQTLLAAQLSSYFSDPGTYFALFEFPTPSRPYEAIPTKEGYFAQLLGKRAATHINNCLTYIQPKFIILLGLSEIAQTYLRAILPEQKLLTVNTEAELLALPFAAGGPECLECRPSQVIEGLIAAKIERRPLAFAEDAPELPVRPLFGKEGLVVIESSGEVGEISIVNYASSVAAEVVLVAPLKREHLHSLPRQLQTWAADRSSPALRQIRKKITDRIKDIKFSRHQFATFFTSGLPYGLILENIIPFTHVLNGPYCGVFIANAIIEEACPPTGSALLFSLDEFVSDETHAIEGQLDQRHFLVTALTGRRATNENLTNYGAHLPYDLLHICSHGGETDGYFVKQEFKDRESKTHIIEYFEVVSFSVERAADPDNVLVESKMIFTSFDGIPWIERPLSIYPAYVGEDMMHALRDDDQTLKRTPVDVPIALSCHIKCYESFHQGTFNSLAALAHPIIFNNSCSSSHELAAGFLAGGARSYVATLWNVGNQTAAKAALAFYKSVLSDGTVLTAFSAMLRSINNPRYQNIYILWGLHFSSFVRPAHKSEDNIIAGLITSYSLWMKKLATTKDHELKRNARPIVRFIMSEIHRRLAPERLRQMLAESDEDEMERSPIFNEESQVNELIVTKRFKPFKAEEPST